MSSPAFSAPLTLEPGRSPALDRLLVVQHILAASGLLLLPWTWAAIGGALLGASAAYEWRRARQRVWLCWQADQSWDQPGDETPATLNASTFVSRWLVVLALDNGRRIRRWAVPRDALCAVQWRRLRSRLRVIGTHLTTGKD